MIAATVHCDEPSCTTWAFASADGHGPERATVGVFGKGDRGWTDGEWQIPGDWEARGREEGEIRFYCPAHAAVDVLGAPEPRVPVAGEWWVRKGTPAGTPDQRLQWCAQGGETQAIRIDAYPGPSHVARAHDQVWGRTIHGATLEMPLSELRNGWEPAQ